MTQGEQVTSDGSTPLKQFNLTSRTSSKPDWLVRHPELSIQLVLGRQGQQVFLWKEPGQGLQVGLGDTRRAGTMSSRVGFDEVWRQRAVAAQTWET